MLCLEIRDTDDSIIIQVPGHRSIIIKSLRGGTRLGFEAPSEIRIDRESVYLSRQRGEKLRKLGLTLSDDPKLRPHVVLSRVFLRGEKPTSRKDK